MSWQQFQTVTCLWHQVGWRSPNLIQSQDTHPLWIPARSLGRKLLQKEGALAQLTMLHLITRGPPVWLFAWPAESKWLPSCWCCKGGGSTARNEDYIKNNHEEQEIRSIKMKEKTQDRFSSINGRIFMRKFYIDWSRVTFEGTCNLCFGSQI